MKLIDRLTAPGPKRMLALDGGGIRGALTLGFLERMEGILRRRHLKPDLRLSDYFDLIGGTSTGAIIDTVAVPFTFPSTDPVASTNPRNMDPVSPMKIDAGLKL